MLIYEFQVCVVNAYYNTMITEHPVIPDSVKNNKKNLFTKVLAIV